MNKKIEVNITIDSKEPLSEKTPVNKITNEIKPVRYRLKPSELYFYISVAIFTIALIALIRLFDTYLAASLLIALSGNYLVGIITQGLHTELGNREHDEEMPEGIEVRKTAALLEMVGYLILLSIGQLLVLTGYLVIKSVGSHWGSKERPSEEGNAVAVYRIGIILQLIIASIAAHYLSMSPYFNETILPALDFLMPTIN